MNTRRNRVLRSTFMRYILSYLLLIVLLFAGVTLFMYRHYTRLVFDTAATAAANKLSHIRYQHESELGALHSIAEHLSLSASVEPFRFDAEPQKAYALLQQLKPYAATNDFCDQMYLVFNDDDVLYSSVTSIRLELFLNQLMRYEHVTPEALGAMLQRPQGLTMLSCQRVDSALLDGATTRVATVILPLGANRDNKGALIFLIRESKYTAMLSSLPEMSDGNTYILRGGETLASVERVALPEMPQALMAGGAGEPTPLTAEGAQYVAVSLEGAYDMRYLAVVPLYADRRAAYAGLTSFLVLLGVLTALCLLLIAFFVRNNYRPIRELRSLFPEAEKTPDDILAIQQGIRELFGHNDDLRERLTRSLPADRMHFTRQAIKGRYHSRAEAVAVAQALGLNIDARFFMAMLLGDPESRRAPDADGVANGAREGVTILQTELMHDDLLLLLAFSDEAQRLTALADALCVEGGGATVAVSAIHEDFSMFSRAYLEANSAYENRFVMGGGRVLRFHDISGMAQNVLPRARSYTEGIRQAILSGRREALPERLDALLAFLKRTDMSLFAFRMIYNDVIAALLRQSDWSVVGAEEAAGLYDIFTLSSCRSIDDLDGILRSLCERLLPREAGGPLPEDAETPIRRVIDYIGEHFDDPNLSLAQVAARFEMSATRVSLECKERLRQTPSEYLLTLRMEKAKKLLAETGLSIKDICARVGYYDVSSFIRRFRQYASITPTQYRANLREGERNGHAQG